MAKETVSVLLSVTASESINASSRSVVASVSQSTSRQNNSVSSSTSPSTYNCSATESNLVPFIAVNDLLPPVAVQALVVAAAAPLASVALSTSVAGVLQRNFVALRFSGCASSDARSNGIESQRGQSMSVSENPTRLSFGDSAGAMYRGAAVGNMLLVAAAGSLIAPVGLVYSRCKKPDTSSAPRTLAASLGKLRLPGRAFVVLAVLLQPTVTAAAGLLMMSPLPVGDVVLSIVTIGVLVLLVGAPAWIVLRGCRVLVTAVDIPSRGGVVDYIAGRRVAWIPRSELPLTSSGSWLLDRSVAGAECFALQFNSFIGRVGSGAWRELYFLFGCLWSVVTGVVGALDPNDLTSCYVAQITLVVVPALSLITLLVVRPFISPFDRNLHTVLDLLSLAVAILSCVNEGQVAQSVSYVEVAMSTGVSLVRILLQLEIKKTTSNSKRGAPLDPKISPRNPFGKQRSNHHRQSVVEKQYMQHDIISSDSSTRQHQIYAVIIHSAELWNAGHPHRSTLPLDPSMVIAAGEEMCRHALEYGRHRTSNTFGSAFIPMAVQRRHLLRLILMATQMSAHASRSEPPV
ncbi:membrane-associated protein, putative [Bodo saltans]|uniref:Membrane-associated protein, putative n=1 Tax=Bodo saltans TaxID=75058 RepID=A0A0S4J1K7_BODSA|nr:membrane-associated protein, putative [Bodo saltans]|eukprot:CUG09354.1 membrane-associated protein, putative [Bodo saltans]